MGGNINEVFVKPDIMKICSADGGDNENEMMMIRPAARNLSLIFELDKRDPKTMGKETRKVFQSRSVSA